MKATPEIIEQLKQEFAPEGSTRRKAQIRMTEMLVWFDSVMRENNIPYYIDYGTLLGAVRHGGFIPWDDDVDVSIPYEYYKKAEIALIKANHPQFILQNSKTDRYSLGTWSVIRDTKSQYVRGNDDWRGRLHNLKKYQGLQIDLFPVDDKVNPAFQKILSKRNYGWFVINHFGTSLAAKECARSFIALHKLICTICRVFTHKNDMIALAYGTDGNLSKHNKIDVFPLSEISFEGHMFMAPKNVDKCLKDYYGEYMDLPSLEDFNHHNLDEIKIW